MIVKTKEQYDKLLVKLLDEPLIAIDTETEGFGNDRSKIFEMELYGVGVYAGKVKAYIPKRFLKKSFQKVLNKSSCIFHNAKFDLTILEGAGFDVSKIVFYDTMIMAWLLNENRHSFGLKNLAKSVLKVNETTEWKDIGNRPGEGDPNLFSESLEKEIDKWENIMGKYCIDDCKYTYKLFQKFKPRIDAQELWKEFSELEMPFVEVLRNMEKRGIKLDLDYLRGIGKKMEAKLITLRAKIYEEAGREVDINSPKQLAVLLYGEKKYDLPMAYRTNTGKNSTNVSALKYLSEKYKCPIVTSILDYREIFKLHSTYVKGLLDRQKDGVIYASFIQQGTVTGRLSSSNPNLQNIPRREDEFDIRKAFVAREGYTFVISDLSQIELRLAAYYSKDETLLKAYQDGKDIHQETADALGCERVIAKTVNFGLLYGRTAYGMAKEMDMTADAAEKFIKKYFAKFKKLKIFIQQAENTLDKNYAVQTLLKRKRRFPDYAQAKKEGDWKAQARIKRQTVNSIIQGSAADIMKVQMRNLSRVLPKFDAHLLIQIHDEVLIEVPKEKAEEVAKLVKYEMENAIILTGVPIITEPQISNSWVK